MISRHRPIIRLALLDRDSNGRFNCLARGLDTGNNAPGLAVVDNLDSIRPTEVRLRKLHLVRPDLIPYPIEYEVVC